MNSPCNRGIGSNTRVVPSDHFMTRVPFSVGSTDRIFKPQTHFMAHPLSQRRNAIAFAGAIGQIPVSLAILVREGLSRPEAVSLALAESYRQAAFPATNTMRPCLRSTHGHEAMSVANRRRNTFSRRSRKTCSVTTRLTILPLPQLFCLVMTSFAKSVAVSGTFIGTKPARKTVKKPPPKRGRKIKRPSG